MLNSQTGQECRTYSKNYNYRDYYSYGGVVEMATARPTYSYYGAVADEQKATLHDTKMYNAYTSDYTCTEAKNAYMMSAL